MRWEFLPEEDTEGSFKVNCVFSISVSPVLRQFYKEKVGYTCHLVSSHPCKKNKKIKHRIQTRLGHLCFLLRCSPFWQIGSTFSTISQFPLLNCSDLSHQTWFTSMESHSSEHRRKWKIPVFQWKHEFPPSSECNCRFLDWPLANTARETW